MAQWEQTYEFPAGGTLAVDQRSGFVKVTGWDRPEIKLAAVSEDDDLVERLQVHQASRGLTVEVLPARTGLFGFLNGGRTAIHLTFMVPVGTACRIDAGSGDVEVTGTEAPLELDTGSGHVAVSNVHDADIETGSGHVKVSHVLGQLKVETGSGSLLVTDVQGGVTLETGSGRVGAERVQGPLLQIDTGSGTVGLTAIDVGRLLVDGGSGRVEAELLAIHPGGHYQIDTGSGGVRVSLPADADVALDLDAGSGGIQYTGLDLRILEKDRGELKATLGNGGAHLDVDTGSGGIRLHGVEGMARVASVPEEEASPTHPLQEIIRQDAALENSEQIKRVLRMVEEGKLSPAEAEELLSALDEEETPA